MKSIKETESTVENVTKKKRTTHRVARGEGIAHVCARYAISERDILLANARKYPAISKSYVAEGWVLDIPARRC